MINRFLRLFATPGLVVAGLASCQPAVHAGFVNFTASTTGSAMNGQTYATFDNRTLGNSPQVTGTGVSVSFTGGGAFVQNSSSGQYAPPTLSGGNNTNFGASYTGADTTTYISTGAGSATLTFTTGPTSYLGILWGSIDSYNSLTFNFTDGTTQTIMGSAILAALTSNTTGTAYVNFNGSAFNSVVASSSAVSFEFDNVAFTAVPEPSSMVLCGLAGIIGLGTARARRRRLAV